jgi:hypothetical protein
MYIKGDWQYKFSTPSEQSEKWGGDCGGLCHVFVETEKRIYGRPTHKTVCDLLGWRDDNGNRSDEVLATAQLICKAPKMFEAINEVLEVLESGGSPNMTWVKNRLAESVK